MERIHNFKNKLFENEKIKSLQDWFIKFFSYDLYIALLFLVAIVNWKFKLVWMIFVVCLLFILIIYFFRISKEKLIPVAISAIISLRLEKVDYIFPIIVGFIIVLFLLIYDLIRKKPIFNNGILTGFILVFISQVFSLINTPVLKTSLEGVFMWAFYILLFLYILNLDFKDDNKNYGRYFLSKIFVFLSIAIFIEIILYYLEYGIGQNIISFYASDSIDFGWATTNEVAMIYILILPILLYYYTFDQKKYYLLLIVAIDVLMLHLMLSRGAYLAMILLVIPLILKTLHDVKHKTNFVITIIYSSIIILIGLIIVAIPLGYVKEFFDFLSKKGLTIEERQLISRIGFNVFQRNPLFGGGANSSSFYLSIAIDKNYYDNFIIQTLAETGIIGFVSFGYLLIQAFRYALMKNKFNSYILIILIALAIQGLIETTFYNIIVMILLAIILPLLATDEEKIIY